ncbi:tripartite tricarboxylate transporter TctB family protein [Agrobacterium sp. BA1120]|uniref:tripartite tricarboxylate transporter TctB family protein n=1 Tax=Agrobacterium sp. BA1120 TaxID=3228927 RepID=UPI00336AAA5A
MIKAPKDFWTGSIYLFVGLVGLFIAKNYNFGTTTRMGPGFFPILLTSLLVVVGVVAVVRSFFIDGTSIGKIPLKPLLAITGSIVVFGLTVEPLGGPIAMLLNVVVAAWASREFRLAPAALIGAVCLVGICSLVFIELLNVPIPLVGTWLQPLVPNF